MKIGLFLSAQGQLQESGMLTPMLMMFQRCIEQQILYLRSTDSKSCMQTDYATVANLTPSLASVKASSCCPEVLHILLLLLKLPCHLEVTYRI